MENGTQVAAYPLGSSSSKSIHLPHEEQCFFTIYLNTSLSQDFLKSSDRFMIHREYIRVIEGLELDGEASRRTTSLSIDTPKLSGTDLAKRNLPEAGLPLLLPMREVSLKYSIQQDSRRMECLEHWRRQHFANTAALARLTDARSRLHEDDKAVREAHWVNDWRVSWFCYLYGS